MKDIIKYISAIATLCVFFSCSFKEDFASNKTHSVEYIARITGFNNVDVATKSASTEEFETAVYTAYFLLFDSNTGDRIAIESVDVTGSSLSQTIVGKMPGSVTACFIANVSEDDVNDLTTLDALNSAVLNITYATYTEAGGYLGVPKLTVNGESKLCIPMFGSVPVNNLTNGGNIEIPVKRLFAKVSMNIKMQLTNVGIGQIVPSTVNYELKQYQLHNLPIKVRLVGNDKENETTYESDWVDVSSAFVGNNVTPISSGNNLGLQTVNINDSDNDTTNDSNVVPGIDFCFYVPEYYLQPIGKPTENQKSKPQNYDYDDKFAIYLELEGEVNRSLIDNTGISYDIYLGGDNTKNFILKRNLHYINEITIKGTENNNQGTGDNLDHRVSVDIVNNPVAQAGKAANCYIIAKPGEYTIPAYKGAYNNLNGATLCMAGKNMSEYETQVAVLANVVEYENITSITFSAPPTYDPETNTISFTVNPMLGNENWVPNGSVIMALQYRRKGETTWTTEWSWHLWFMYSITADEDGWGTIGYQTMPDGNNIMDRNLGVHAATLAGTAVGFYYKYGEHTPYLDPDGDDVYTQFGGGNVSSSVPTWNVSGKSVTDPCPPGYRVPSKGAWAMGAGQDGSSALSYIYNLYNPTVAFSYTGYLNGSNVSSSAEEEKDFTLDNYKMTPLDLGNLFPSYINESGGLLSKNKTRTRVDDVTEYYDFVYTAKTQTNYGRFWYSNGEAYHYEFYDLDWTKVFENAFVIKECQTVTYKKYQDEKSTNYGVTWSNVGAARYDNYQYGKKSSGFELYIATIFLEARKRTLSGTNSKHVSLTDYGYQVRCIKE